MTDKITMEHETMITVQARKNGSEAWGTRSAFVTENKLVKIGQMSREELLRKANDVLSKWRISGLTDDLEMRVHDDAART